MAKRRGLGRGLDALLSGAATGAPSDPSAERTSHGELRALAVDLIDRGRFQPRTRFDAISLEALTESVRSQGVVQPVVVRPVGGGRYELIAGERRWRASQAAGLAEIPAIVRDIPDDAALPIALIENIQREDLNPLEEARALKRLIGEFDMTHEAAAAAIGRSRAAVSNSLRLLDLEPETAELLERGDIEMGHARALLGLAGPEQRRAAREVVAKGLTARQTEALARRLKNPEVGEVPAARLDPDVRRLQDRLAQHLGATVNIRHERSGKGKITIPYSDLEQLEGILERLRLDREDVGLD